MNANSDIADNITIISAVNDPAILQNNLCASEDIKNGNLKLLTFFDEESASIAYNKGIDQTDTDYIAFIHQDVYLPKRWLSDVQRAISTLESRDPDWAVLGVFGITDDSTTIGHVWCSGSGQLFGEPLAEPAQVECADELGLILRRQSGCRFDPCLPSFHLYGTDIIQSAKLMGLSSYVADIPVVHNSRPVKTIRGGYSTAYRYMRKKWRDHLPIPTLIVPITREWFELEKGVIRIGGTRNDRIRRAVPHTKDPRIIAKEIGFE